MICTEPGETDYLILVNGKNPIGGDWEKGLETVKMTNSLGDVIEAEKKAYEAYLELKKDLSSEGVFVDLDSAKRSIAEQQEIVERFTVEYGEEYVRQYVAVPGYSEHHTGLALDLYLIVDGEEVYYNEDLAGYPEIWAKIHAKLAEHGFILRYPEGKEAITGYAYEPWHIRFLNSRIIAEQIHSEGIAFEEYLDRITGKE